MSARRMREAIVRLAMSTLMLEHGRWMLRHLDEHGPGKPEALEEMRRVASQLQLLRAELERPQEGRHE